MAEYWLEAMERIMNDLDCIPEQKLKGTVCLLRDKAFQWWLTVEEATQPDCLTSDFFKTTFQSKYVGESYVNARRCEFMNLTQADRSAAEFLRLSCYAQSMVASEYERCVHFEDEKAKIIKDVNRMECQNRDRKRGKNKRDSEPSSSMQRPKKKPCNDCGRHHPDECCRRIGACLRCGSFEHRIRDCPHRLDLMQASVSGSVQHQRVVTQPPRGREAARSGNGLGRG
ncbi:uncharacterized protein LOC108484817 [Gossypium arboreum]|uniref:uncharacterized protein LOC108484817 n=1 Tax=Gossypium arboreum TaxID=29729 RepID=UPI0008193F18|nr:uncharacterized protein LOC108484817 [Gossypium arboreum]